MPLHPLATEFAGVADVYERGRPDYSPAVVGAFTAELGLERGSRVLDLAAGTGKLTRALVAAGLDVTAVEPLREMRGILAGTVGPERVIEGVAENIPLEDGSVDAVTVADAFHWFDQPAALAEIARVLRPGGGLALLVTMPDWRGASWGHDLGELISSLRPAHPGFDGPPFPELVRATPGWESPREIRVSVAQQADPARIVDYVGSMSWVAQMPPERRASTLERVAELIAAGETPDELRVTFLIWLTAQH
ncbi:MAG: smtA [Solirubrobacteraceae bacterium]|nr:smtA [Solirubrobacteraceae bacterium]